MDEQHPAPKQMRASDDDRDQAASRLSHALAEGRLELDEYHGRLERVLAAKTFAELAPITADLPLSKAERQQAAKAREVERKRKATAEWIREWQSWLGAGLIMTLIWGFASLQRGEVTSFWPAIPLGIWAIILVAGILWPKDPTKRDG